MTPSTRLNIDTLVDTMISVHLTRVPELKRSSGFIDSPNSIDPHSDTSNAGHPSPRLYSDLIWVVLECLVERLRPYDLDYTITSDHYPSGATSSYHRVDRVQSYYDGLRDRMLVCREWYHITKKHLYAQPILVSPVQLYLFRISLEHNPSLQNLVDGVCIADSPRCSRSDLHPFGSQALHNSYAELVRNDAQHILMRCKGMKSITLHSSSLPFTSSINSVFSGEAVLGDHQVQKLTLSGIGGHQALIDSPSFDNLQRLIVQDGEYFPRVQFSCSFP